MVVGTGKLMFEEKVLISITFHHCISQFLNVAKTHLCSQMYIVMHQCTNAHIRFTHVIYVKNAFWGYINFSFHGYFYQATN